MPGSYIPVLEIEKLKFRVDGRGIYANSDGDVIGTDTWTGTWCTSGQGATASSQSLPAASATRWLKVTSVSGTDGTETVGYIPIFNAYW